MRRVVIAAVVSMVVAGLFATPVLAQDRDCPDFGGDQQAAQRYFESIGGSATNNADRLDRDGDGIACEEDGGGNGAAAGAEGDEIPDSDAETPLAPQAPVSPVLVIMLALAGVTGLALRKAFPR